MATCFVSLFATFFALLGHFRGKLEAAARRKSLIITSAVNDTGRERLRGGCNFWKISSPQRGQQFIARHGSDAHFAHDDTRGVIGDDRGFIQRRA